MFKSQFEKFHISRVMANILTKNKNQVSSKMTYPFSYRNKVGIKKTTPSEDNLAMKMFNVYPPGFTLHRTPAEEGKMLTSLSQNSISQNVL